MANTNLSKIPDGLKNEHFCLWKYETVNGKNTKVPYNPRTGGKAQSTNPDTFDTFDNALKEYERTGKYSGLGVGVFGDLVGVDIDHCIKDGKLTPHAEDIVKRLDTYTEISPSGTGLRLFGRASGFQYGDQYYKKNPDNGTEVYVAGNTSRFMTVTGNVINNKPVRDVSGKLPALLEQYMKRPEKKKAVTTPVPVNMGDAELTEKIRQSEQGRLFDQLMAGDTTGYNSQSEADLSLCNILAFWTGRDAHRIDSIFRTSGLYRGKWDEKHGATTYGEQTVTKAIEGCMNIYEPNNTQTQPAKKEPVTSLWDDYGIEAKDLRVADIPLPQFCVEGIVPEGLTVIASAPKTGKTWLGLDMCLSVAGGVPFMGFETVQGRTLYLDLESNKNAMKQRLVLMGETDPEGVVIVHKTNDKGERIIPTMDKGFIDLLEAYYQNHPDLKLVVIDTLVHIKYHTTRTASMYDTEYQTGTELNQWALKHHVSVVVLTHITKLKYDDPLECVSGTNGVTGSADCVIVLQKDKRFKDDCTFSVMCRYAESSQYSMHFQNFRWQNTGVLEEGTQAERERQQRLTDYMDSDTRNKLVQFMAGREMWQGRCKELKETALAEGIPFMASNKEIGGFLTSSDNRTYLYEYDKLEIAVAKHGNASQSYTIRKLTSKEQAQQDGFEDGDFPSVTIPDHSLTA